ncbi:C4-dicarboxylate-specific signal transduction histidine kinase [Paucibacter oligotrophus]|uniref:histidine kinase n=1 Tax=Roseateles oligotrophus TaxID=1769250 RepID=A0A840LCE5_9BURK|nr:ATP-binding protein [Roseateles oligotrophus]MBB4844322.1 C4-dicarboxylate-specific signal transduction histidine kinase [Roseateles oligotrophus]
MKSISNSLLRRVMSIYLLSTFAIFGFEIALQFNHGRAGIAEELGMFQNIFHGNISHGMWHMDPQEVDATVAGLLQMPSVSRVIISLPNGDVFRDAAAKDKEKTAGLGSSRIFRSLGAIRYRDSRSTEVLLGRLEIQSNGGVILSRLRPWIATALLAAALKTLILIFLVRLFFSRILSRPLFTIARLASEIDPKDARLQALPVKPGTPDELDVISIAINGLLTEVGNTVGALDQLNKGLEAQVADRTAKLQSANVELARQQEDLRSEVSLRRQKELDLQHVNSSLAESLDKLQLAQQSLVEAGKMAALGALVAGVAHEINTPVGLSLTGSSHFKYMVEQLEEQLNAGQLSETDLASFLQDAKELARTICASLEKAAALVGSFKLLAVDQVNDEIREFEPREYIEDVLLTHQQLLKRARVSVAIDCEASLTVRSYAGAWSQILSNLISNSINHGLTPEQADPRIEISVCETAQELTLVYQDNGQGMSEETAKKIYDPFFTTNRQAGGSGLGMHIVYNLVVQKLHGQIRLVTAMGEGVKFTIQLSKSG